MTRWKKDRWDNEQKDLDGWTFWTNGFKYRLRNRKISSPYAIHPNGQKHWDDKQLRPI